MDDLIEFDFVRRQSEVSLNVEKDYNCNTVNVTKYTLPKKLVQRSNTYTPRDLPRINRPVENITLPDRYRWKVRRKSASQNIVNINVSSLSILENIDEEGGFDFSERWEDRKRDMEDAIKWVRQELNNLKRQDKVLKKRLHDLGSAIQQIRGIQSCPSLAHSISSLSSGASWLSLDDGTFAHHPGDPNACIAGGIMPRDNVWAFRARMLAEFQKSKPNLNIQSKSVSLCNVRNTSEEDIKNFRGSSNSSSSSAVFVRSSSSCSGEDDDEDIENRGYLVSSRSDSLINSVEEETCDFEQPNENTDNEEEVENDEEEVESDTLKLKERIASISSGDSSTDQDSVSYEDSTLTRDNSNDKTITDSLEDILTAVSTQEEREGMNADDDDDKIEYMV